MQNHEQQQQQKVWGGAFASGAFFARPRASSLLGRRAASLCPVPPPRRTRNPATGLETASGYLKSIRLSPLSILGTREMKRGVEIIVQSPQGLAWPAVCACTYIQINWYQMRNPRDAGKTFRGIVVYTSLEEPKPASRRQQEPTPLGPTVPRDVLPRSSRLIKDPAAWERNSRRLPCDRK
ncbi:uncharacterized protein LOC123331458 isoform X2 [Bubalus bubalis]|uniref:uncharacterized protein LOC123331458 isoform X2 n=1 Tax=Bubalus bubalis TaxID=89462 RepID=UPI001D11EF5B|nr:uncharacterized protein LOC123331458 isoform X2 [Bubalus bubalis]